MPPFWDEVAIVAGGPSRYLFNGGYGTVLAVNDGWDIAPRATAVLSIDQWWAERNWARLVLARCERYLALDEGSNGWGMPGVTYLRRAAVDGLSYDRDSVAGGNSGHAAINLAILKHARRIFLYGFDMDGDKYRIWRGKFHKLAEQLNGIQVLNMNPYSTIEAFPKA